MTWALACDASYDMPDPAALKAAGYDVVMGYLSDTPGKGITPAYRDKCAAAHVAIHPLYETTATMALGGRTAGRQAATTATGIAARLGCPAAVDITYAADSNFTGSQMAGPVSDFVRGLHDVAGPDDMYGGYDQLAYLIAHGLGSGREFQTYAWSGGRWLPAGHAPVEQYRNGVKLAGGTVDLCRIDTSKLTLWNPGDTMTDAALSTDTLASIGLAVLAGKIPNIPADADFKTLPNTALNTAIYRIRLASAAAQAAAAQANATLAGIVKSEAALQTAMAGLATALTTGSGSPIDTAALAAQIKAIGDTESAGMSQVLTALAAAEQEIADLRAALAAGANAEAAALTAK